MLKIAVCDDNPIFLEELQTLLPGMPQVEEVRCYSHPEQLRAELAGEGWRADLVLMDIHFEGEKNGLQWAEEMNRLVPSLDFICITGYNDAYVQHLLLHEINLIGYLTKPLDRELLSRYLDKALLRRRGAGFLSFVLRGKSYCVAAEEIDYCESHNHKVIVHTRKEDYEFYEKLSSLQPRLPACFVQCHKSYLVNLDRVARMEPGALVLTDGNTVPVSKAYQHSVQETFFHHIGQDI